MNKPWLDCKECKKLKELEYDNCEPCKLLAWEYLTNLPYKEQDAQDE